MFGRRRDGSLDQRWRDERPRGVVNDNHLRAWRNRRKRVGHGILPALAALDDDHVIEIGRWSSRQVRGKGNDDFVERIALEECIDGALEDRHAGKHLELLRLRAAKPGTAASGSNDRGNVHELRF